MKQQAEHSRLYWQHRLNGGGSNLTASGHRSLGEHYNAWIYRRRLEALASMLEEIAIPNERLKILDIGCGNGFFTRFWQEHGVAGYWGIDFAAPAVARLTARYPAFHFKQADITQPQNLLPDPNSFNLITVFDVLYHVVDDADYNTVLDNLHHMLSPDGYIFIFDQLAPQHLSMRNHVVYRSRDFFHQALARAGLKMVRSEKLFAFLAPPVFGKKLPDFFIAACYKLAGLLMTVIPPIGNWAGRTVYGLDKFLLRHKISPPNHELFILRKK